MKIQVLGSGCAKCKNLHKTVEEVVKKLNLDTMVEYSTDVTKIVELLETRKKEFISLYND